jgi:hypothetical protein
VTTEPLVKIQIPLAGNDESAGYDTEMLWARPCGDALFEVQSIPFFAYNVNLHDVVQCDPAVQPPRFLSVHEPSGCETLRLVFTPEVDAQAVLACIKELRNRGAVVEPGAAGRFFALSFRSWPELKDAVALLDATTDADRVSYETGFRSKDAQTI